MAAKNKPEVNAPDVVWSLAQLLDLNPCLGKRDMRDLLIEYGADGVTASDLTSDRA